MGGHPSGRIALLRLLAQRLAGPPCETPTEVVRWLTAAQGQDLPGALTSIALRTTERSITQVQEAFDRGEIVRTWPMRGTLHVIAAEDIHWMLELMTPRPLAAAARRRTQLGLSDADLSRAEELVREEIARRGAMLRAEVVEVWERAGLPTGGGRGYHLLAHLAQTAVLCLGPWRGGDQAFVLVDEWVPAPRGLEREQALGEITRRYLASHGPATVKDLARWTGLTMRDVRTGLALAAEHLTTLDVDGVEHHLDPHTLDLLQGYRKQAREALLLPGFDELVLGYADRTATVPAEHSDRVVPGGNGMFRSTVVLDGRVVGVWRRRTRRGQDELVLEPFTDLRPTAVARIERAFARLP